MTSDRMLEGDIGMYKDSSYLFVVTLFSRQTDLRGAQRNLDNKIAMIITSQSNINEYEYKKVFKDYYEKVNNVLKVYKEIEKNLDNR